MGAKLLVVLETLSCCRCTARGEGDGDGDAAAAAPVGGSDAGVETREEVGGVDT